MAVFVLVHGAWHGGWCWTQTAQALEDAGHKVHTPTLTGQGERCHQLSADITPDTHVVDIKNVLEWRELQDVILVGHSYGGLIITGVASRIPERLKALVYLDAFVPEQSGLSIFSEANPERMKGFQAQIDAGAVGLQPDAAVDTWVASAETKAWLLKRCTPQPKGTLTQGVTLSGRETEVAQKHFILAAHNKTSPFVGEYEKVKGRSGWTTEAMPCLHDAMIEDAVGLADRLRRYAKGLDESRIEI